MSLPVVDELAAAPWIRGQVNVPIRIAEVVLTARLFTFGGLADDGEHIALALGSDRDIPLVRIHSECLTGDVFGSQRCDCGPQLNESIEQISAHGGYLLYLRQEGRGIGLYAKVDAYLLQDGGLDTFQANRALGFADDERDYTVAAQMLTALGVETIDLLTNNPDKTAQLRAAGISIAHEVRTGFYPTLTNNRYLAAKAASGHRLDPDEPGGMISR